jgi:predicted PolB exonuclease-like 3'-5' exonuclease
MIRNVANRVWAFDIEWVPDPLAGRLLYDVDAAVPAEDVLQVMWERGGASEDDPTPFLKIALCRIVSVAAVERLVRPDGSVTVRLMSLPHEPGNAPDAAEPRLVERFLGALGQHRPQLVGYNSLASDLRILIQRGLILGVRAADFCRRPDKPWEGVDYFARTTDWHIDLKEILAGWGRGAPSLHQVAVQCGVPGKMDVDGDQVAGLWLAGELETIVRYNELDALTTYLVWLRLAHFAGHFSTDAYVEEQERLRTLLEELVAEPGREHLARYLEEWRRLTEMVESARGEAADPTPQEP